MTASHDRKPSTLYWALTLALLLWALAGLAIYAAYVLETPEQFAAGAEDPAHRDAYADYVANIPLWAIGAGVIAAACRFFGAIGLLLRRAWSAPFYVASLAFFLAALFRAFVLADVASVMSPRHIAIEFVFVGLSVFAIWFAYRCKAAGLLR